MQVPPRAQVLHVARAERLGHLFDALFGAQRLLSGRAALLVRS